LQINLLKPSLDLYLFQARIGLGTFLRGIDFSRSIEYPLSVNRLGDVSGLEVLDIGGGTSAVSIYLARNNPGASFTVMDVDQEVLDYAAKCISTLGLNNIKTKLGDATGMEVEDASYDLVISISCLEHIPEDGDSRAAAEISRILKPGGEVLITVPYAPSFREEIGQFGFIRHYDAGSLRERLIKPSELVVKELVYYNDSFCFGNRVAYRELPVGRKIRDRLVVHLSPYLGPALCNLHATPPARDSGALLVLEKPRG
jgi:SAM-dependent methyltransferase